MRVLVITNSELKEELLAMPVSDTIQFDWLHKPEELDPKHHFDACIDLLFENTPERIKWLRSLPASPLIIINAVIIPLQQIDNDFIRINGWTTFLKRPVVEASLLNPLLKEKAADLFLQLGRKTAWTPDIAGFITPRVIASVINEAFFTLQEAISTTEEIDIAMKLGTNYPYGPFEWAGKIGLPNIHQLLSVLSAEQSRYQPATLLIQKAIA